MADVIRFRGEGGVVMLVEVESAWLDRDRENDVGLVVDRRAGRVGEAVVRLEDSLRSVEGAAVALISTVQALRERDGGLALDEVALELSLSFGVEGGVVVAKGNASAEASVTLTWRSPSGG